LAEPAYCTILARNYLPSALALGESLLVHGDGVPLTVVLIDATDETDLPDLPGVRWMHPDMLDLDERAVHELAMSYNLVEFATAVKPLVLQKLLAEHEQAAYLDPDTYVVSPMEELAPALDAGEGIVLTPHYLEPVPAVGQGTRPAGDALHEVPQLVAQGLGDPDLGHRQVAGAQQQLELAERLRPLLRVRRAGRGRQLHPVDPLVVDLDHVVRIDVVVDHHLP
jgi:hypothetical protein